MVKCSGCYTFRFKQSKCIQSFGTIISEYCLKELRFLCMNFNITLRIFIHNGMKLIGVIHNFKKLMNNDHPNNYIKTHTECLNFLMYWSFAYSLRHPNFYGVWDIANWNKFKALLILQAFRHFTYVTAHSPTLPSLYLRHSSFSNLSVASPTLQLILQFLRRFT